MSTLLSKNWQIPESGAHGIKYPGASSFLGMRRTKVGMESFDLIYWQFSLDLEIKNTWNEIKRTCKRDQPSETGEILKMPTFKKD